MVVTSIGGSPCGACRQVMAEFALHMPVVIADLETVRSVNTVAELLPGAFLPHDLLERAALEFRRKSQPWKNVASGCTAPMPLC